MNFTDKDEGKGVLYNPIPAGAKSPCRFTPPTEYGIIKCVTDQYVFVCFQQKDGSWTQAMACYPENLRLANDYFELPPDVLLREALADLEALKKCI